MNDAAVGQLHKKNAVVVAVVAVVVAVVAVVVAVVAVVAVAATEALDGAKNENADGFALVLLLLPMN